VSYPRKLDLMKFQEKIERPAAEHIVQFKKETGMNLLSEIINTRIMEDSVSESLHKKHIVNKYIMKNKENSLLKSRTKLDSLRFNYSFGDDYIDNNEKLKAFMTKTIEKLKYRRTPMSHELVSLTQMVDEHQKDALNRESIKEARREMKEDPDNFLRNLSPLYDGIADL
jgi:hypothetical protein